MGTQVFVIHYSKYIKAQKYITTFVSFFSNSLDNVGLSSMQKEKDGAGGI